MRLGCRPVTSLGHQEGRRVFWEGPKFFELCPIVSHYILSIFAGGGENFSRGTSPPLVTGLLGWWTPRVDNLKLSELAYTRIENAYKVCKRTRHYSIYVAVIWTTTGGTKWSIRLEPSESVHEGGFTFLQGGSILKIC